MKFSDVMNEAKSYSDIEKAIIQDLKKNKKKIVKETALTHPAPESHLDVHLINLMSVFKKHFGGIGSVFSVSDKDKLSVPEGTYKILKYILKGDDFDIKLQKVGEKNIFKKTLKVHLKNFLQRSGYYK